MPSVLRILPGDRAVVSTEGLYRIIDRHDGTVLDELLDAELAGVFVDYYNGGRESGPAVAVAYTDAERPALA